MVPPQQAGCQNCGLVLRSINTATFAEDVRHLNLTAGIDTILITTGETAIAFLNQSKPP